MILTAVTAIAAVIASCPKDTQSLSPAPSPAASVSVPITTEGGGGPEEKWKQHLAPTGSPGLRACVHLNLLDYPGFVFCPQGPH